MEYALAVIGIALVVLALIGKPIRIEIIHTVTPQPLPPEVVQQATATARAATEALGVMAYVNETFHNVEKGDPNV